MKITVFDLQLPSLVSICCFNSLCSQKNSFDRITVRKHFLPFTYSVVQAPACCNQGTPKQKSHALELAKYLESIQCSDKWSVDVAMDDFANKMNLENYLVASVVSNMFSPIGLYSNQVVI